jgi:hypothetical protein
LWTEDWIDDCGLKIGLPIVDLRSQSAGGANRQSAMAIGNRQWQSPIANRQSAIGNRQSPIANRQSKSQIGNRQSVNLQSAVGNRQSVFRL